MARAGSGISGTAIFIVLGGSVLLYAGLKGKSPASTFRALIAGQSPTTVGQSTPIESAIAGVVPVDSGLLSGIASGNTTFDPSTSAVGGTVAKNKAIGRMLATAYGWGSGDQWTALDMLWTRESGWRNDAENQSSGALGIAQALPPSKYPVAGQKPILSASAQIAWGLNYIAGRYGNPVNAWAHETQFGWY